MNQNLNISTFSKINFLTPLVILLCKAYLFENIANYVCSIISKCTCLGLQKIISKLVGSSHRPICIGHFKVDPVLNIDATFIEVWVYETSILQDK